jgi:hypothetical protein
LETTENFDLNRAKQDDENEAFSLKITEAIIKNVEHEHDRIYRHLGQSRIHFNS